MKTRWQEGNEEREMTSPLSLVISAFARVEDVRHTITPQLSTEDNALLLIDLGKGNNALAQRRWRRFIVSLATNRQMYATSRN